MRNLGPIARRELGSLFLSPIAWVVMTAFLALFGVIFASRSMIPVAAKRSQTIPIAKPEA